MTAAEQPIPAALALDDEPFDDELLDAAVERGSSLADEDPNTLTHEAQQQRAVQVWVPTDVGGAEWAMRKLGDAQQNLDEITRQAAEWQARIDAWHAGMVEKVQRRAAFFRGALTRYGLDERERTGQATVILPSGVVKSSSRKARPKVLDREAAAASAVVNLDDEDRAAVVSVPPTPAPVAKATELAKRVRIVEHVLQRTFDVELDGEPRVLVQSTITEHGEPPAVGDSWPYDDGFEQAERTVLAVEEVAEQRVVEQVVVWSDTGQPVAGVVVEPARIDVAVEPR